MQGGPERRGHRDASLAVVLGEAPRLVGVVERLSPRPIALRISARRRSVSAHAVALLALDLLGGADARKRGVELAEAALGVGADRPRVGAQDRIAGREGEARRLLGGLRRRPLAPVAEEQRREVLREAAPARACPAPRPARGRCSLVIASSEAPGLALERREIALDLHLVPDRRRGLGDRQRPPEVALRESEIARGDA